ncbi:PQQ-binding-like beta-propeller repeat protein [Haloarcula marina]|uniref:outer membrane protein assembly factor BamB family protein n=1 Tax=Haloarcula marina TaxID=2961574 RepID=UPI0020B89DC8|nr:PQQ-binding-like beta-propeller repeat protein [Halomicroarcula marina]
MDRREFLYGTVSGSVFGLSGCLRLTEESTPTASGTQEQPSREGEIGTERDTETPEEGTEGGSETPEEGTEEPPENPDVESLFTVEWEDSESILSPLRLHGDYLYGEVFGIEKLDPSTGKVEWQVEPDHSREDNGISNLVPTETAICVLESAYPNQDPPEAGRIFALDPATGEEMWYFEGDYTTWLNSSAFDASDQYVAFAEDDETTYTTRIFNIETGDVVIERNSEKYVNQLIIQDDELIIIGEDIRILDIESDSITAQTDLPSSAALVTNDGIYTGQNNVHKLSNPGLETEWTASIAGDIQANPTIASESGVLIGGSGGVHSLDRETGEINWEYRTAAEVNEIRGGMVVVNGLAFLWDNSGYFVILNAKTGESYFDQRQKDNGAAPSGLAASDSTLYVACDTDMDTTIPRGTAALNITQDYN